MTARYSIGIDLGTTHCVLSYLDLTDAAEDPSKEVLVSVLAIPQLSQPGLVVEKQQLPSFIYQAHESELNQDDIALPWNAEQSVISGSIARALGSKTPIRLVSSAKSWLCHDGVDRREAFLPMGSPDEVRKISPLDATVEYLEHLQQCQFHLP